MSKLVGVKSCKKEVAEMNNEETTVDESRLEWCTLNLRMKNKD